MLKKIINKRTYEGANIGDDLLFISMQTQVMGLDMNNGYKQIFLSDKLSNMSNFYYDKDSKQLLVYNTSGHAYLYQLPDGKTVIVQAETNTKYVGDYYVAFEPENKRFVPIYPVTEETWCVHTMLEKNKILVPKIGRASCRERVFRAV